MKDTYRFLNKKSYTNKDGEYRCYAMFADSLGNVENFVCTNVPQDMLPKEPFALCDISFHLEHFGQSVYFVAESIQVREVK